jgi:general secretion pathway protein C
MLVRATTFVVWALLAASITFWGLKVFASAPVTPPGTPLDSGNESSLPGANDLARLLGAGAADASALAAPPALNSRFRLAAVIASPHTGSSGIALIAVDGKMARSFLVGSIIDGELVLQSVGLRSASIGPTQGPPAVVLELPVTAPAPGATGTQITSAGLAGQPSVRKATPEEQIRPGRRRALRGHLEQALPDK